MLSENWPKLLARGVDRKKRQHQSQVTCYSWLESGESILLATAVYTGAQAPCLCQWAASSCSGTPSLNYGSCWQSGHPAILSEQHSHQVRLLLRHRRAGAVGRGEGRRGVLAAPPHNDGVPACSTQDAGGGRKLWRLQTRVCSARRQLHQLTAALGAMPGRTWVAVGRQIWGHVEYPRFKYIPAAAVGRKDCRCSE